MCCPADIRGHDLHDAILYLVKAWSISISGGIILDTDASLKLTCTIHWCKLRLQYNVQLVLGLAAQWCTWLVYLMRLHTGCTKTCMQQAWFSPDTIWSRQQHSILSLQAYWPCMLQAYNEEWRELLSVLDSTLISALCRTLAVSPRWWLAFTMVMIVGSNMQCFSWHTKY